jgi:hypothetical protein
MVTGIFSPSIPDANIWAVNVRGLLAVSFGKDIYFEDFSRNFLAGIGNTYMICKSIFLAAKEDYENGYYINQAKLIEANLLGDAIQQAEMLFKADYTQAAAIVAGVALETHLRSLCNIKVIPYDENNSTINLLNAALYKAEVYTQPQMQEIAAWASIRNDATHGRSGKYSNAQVDSMIKGITRFLNEI